MTQYHAVVWLDHSEARVFHINAESVEKTKILASNPHPRLHRKGGVVGSGRLNEDPNFFKQIMNALQGAQEILLIGPAFAKIEFLKYVQKHNTALSKCITGCKNLDHVSDQTIVDSARVYFKALDRMIG